ncbi:putative K(+)-stimulated pyrophosphate-energized sodium pump [Gracilariopsis chorda]|uniref:H(+)-exporting diphosphatase n=1 Tax=Gracilariopsis chorda TaxID=448386 RepID=A0A2V3J371_9FLOR|nr:putative K(+)-stimulated pyrophosphate-energized sodium pump [Gracilariopsis chorda]|eukprot:PXF48891.1 putative K(+)-stimulated pyrophosphate-energized sodium pump [Gracilariopsis chorda]
MDNPQNNDPYEAHRLGLSPAARYDGYQPVDVNDFGVRLQHDPESLILTSLRVYDLPTPLITDSPHHHKPTILAAILSAIFFIVALSLATTTTSCNLGMCDKIDRSSLPSHNYRFRVVPFEAPLRYAWVALAVASLGVCVFCIHVVLIKKRSTGNHAVQSLAALVKHTTNTTLLHQFKYFFPVVIAIFLLLSFTNNWRMGACFLFGAVITSVATLLSQSISAAGSLRAAALMISSVPKAILLALSTASSIVIATIASVLGGFALSYIIVRDVRALSGFVIGSAVIALMIRITGGLFETSLKADDNLKDHSQASRNQFHQVVAITPQYMITSVANLVASNIGHIGGMVAQGFAVYAAAITSTAILGASLPFFYSNPFATCVFNHLALDKECVLYRGGVKVSLAVSICRDQSLLSRYPSFKALESNTAFVALPFILGLVSLVIAVISTLYTAMPKRVGNGNDRGAALCSVIRPLRMNILAAALLTIVSAAALSWSLFGSRSSFQKAAGATIGRYELPPLTTANAARRCRPRRLVTEGENDRTREFPVLNLNKVRYQPLDSHGFEFPRVSQIPLRVFLCVLLGSICTVLYGLSVEQGTGVIESCVQRVMKKTTDKDGAYLTEALGMGLLSTVGGVVVVILATSVSYTLLRAYGIGLCALGMLCTMAPVLAICCVGRIMEGAHAINELCGLSGVGMDDSSRLKGFTQGFWTMCAALLGVCGLVCCLVLKWVLLQETGLLPGSRSLGGTNTLSPSRHITDVDMVDISERLVFLSMGVGVWGVMLFIATMVLGARHARDAMRKKCRPGSGAIASTATEWILRAAQARREAGLETVVIGLVAVIWPLASGLALGQRALVGAVAGAIGISIGLSTALLVFGGVAQASCRAYDPDGEQGPNQAAAHTLGNVAESMLLIGNSVNGAMVFWSALAIGVVKLMQADGARGWIGAVLAAGALMLAVAIMVYLARRAKQSEDRNSGTDVTFRVNPDVVSPFFLEGPELRAENISPKSRLGVLRLESGSEDYKDLFAAVLNID